MDNKQNFITLVHHFIFSPKDFLSIKYSSDKNYRHSWFVFLACIVSVLRLLFSYLPNTLYLD